MIGKQCQGFGQARNMESRGWIGEVLCPPRQSQSSWRGEMELLVIGSIQVPPRVWHPSNPSRACSLRSALQARSHSLRSCSA